MARRPSSRSILSPSSRRMVAGLLIAAGMLLIIGELLRLYVLYAYWRQSGVVSASAAAGVLLGVAAGMGTSYAGWRVGLGG